MLGLYRFYWDVGRSGILCGVFFATSSEIEKLQGKRITFGDVLGKHSDVFGTIDNGDVELITDDPATVAHLQTLNVEIGYNPLDYIEGEED